MLASAATKRVRSSGTDGPPCARSCSYVGGLRGRRRGGREPDRSHVVGGVVEALAQVLHADPVRQQRHVEHGARTGGVHPGHQLGLDLAQGLLQLAVAGRVVGDDVLLERRGDPGALGEDALQALADQAHGAAELGTVHVGQDRPGQRVLEQRGEVVAQLGHELVVAQQREGTLEGAALGGGGHQGVGAGEVLVDHLAGRALLGAERRQDLGADLGEALLDAREVAGQGRDEQLELGEALGHVVLVGGVHVAAVEQPVALGLEPADLGVEDADAGTGIGVGLAVEAAHGREQRPDPVLAERGPVAGERLDLLERLLGVGGEGVDLVAGLVQGPHQPLPLHPALAQVAAGALGQVALPGEAQLGEVLLHLGVQPSGRHRTVVTPERRTEHGDHHRGLALVQQRQRGLLERAAHPGQLTGHLAHRHSTLLVSPVALDPRRRHGGLRRTATSKHPIRPRVPHESAPARRRPGVRLAGAPSGYPGEHGLGRRA